MSDFTRMRNALSIIREGDYDRAWGALYWVFCSTDLEPDGFYRTAVRLGLNPERVRSDLLNRSEIARLFWYGPESEESFAQSGEEAC